MSDEKKILEFWEKNKIFEKTLRKNKNSPVFSFYDGPPFATGLPHYGHILASIIKDVIPRYQTMKGRNVPRRWGWDCHGLPIENLVEQELSLKTKKDIEKFGIENFNKKAKEKVLQYADEWKKVIPRIGRWVDMENDYKTMDKNYTESIWWVFKTLYDKELIYEGYKSMHICPRCETTLSNFEVTQNYQDIKDISVVVKFELTDEPDTYLLVWTTTPWTLPGNVTLAVNPEIEYVKIKINNNFYILAKNRLEVIKSEYKIIGEIKTKDLIGKKYKPLFNYYNNGDWKIYGADFVSTEEGTGIVHIAPAFGEEDMELGQKEKLPFIQHVTMDGKFKPEVKDFAGLDVKPKGNPKETDKKIIKFLGDKVFSSEEITHSYPFCWRCETPLLNYAAASWFVKVTDIKANLIKNNKKINWVPGHLRDGRFGKWLENARDWAVSRSRYWGAPLPVWKCEKCKKIKVVGSVAELPDKKTNLHRPYIDKVEFDCSCGGKMKRVPEVFDCWFESGSMPYGQAHYPFENKESFEASFPAEFIAEGVDQTRGWFYTLLVLSTALFDKPAFKNVVTNGIILAENGQKMSKRLKNYPDPMDIVEKYGADSLRYYLLSSPATRAENLNFSERGVDEVYKKVILRLKNVLAFYKMYTESNQSSVISNQISDNILDKWILARIKILTKEITEALDKYELEKAVRPVSDFIEDLSTWYIRRSRSRFKEERKEKNEAINTTRFILIEFAKIIAPFMPFVAEEIYRDLSGEKESVHLEEWPKVKKLSKNEEGILKEMVKARIDVSFGLQDRAVHKIPVRQPLTKFMTPQKYNDEYVQLIKEELNVKEVVRGAKGYILTWEEITPELKEEGNLRELTRAIQDMRKKLGLIPKDKIELIIETDKADKKFIEKFSTEIKKGVNAGSLILAANSGQEIKIDNLTFKIEIKK